MDPALMRVALNSLGEIGTRAGLILLAERSLSALGIYGGGTLAPDRRTTRISDLAGFDVLVTDDPEPSPIAAIAVEDGLSCVTVAPVEPEVAGRFAAAGRVLMMGADLRGLAATLAAHEELTAEGPVRSTVAWTVPGKALRRGVAVGFPDPVGARWGRPVADGIEVPIAGSWAGAAVTVMARRHGRTVQRLVGVADQREHLEAIALAAGTVTVAGGTLPPGVHQPRAAAVVFLEAALAVGLGVAAHTES